MNFFQVGGSGLRGTGGLADGRAELDAASLVDARRLVFRAGYQRNGRKGHEKYGMFHLDKNLVNKNG